ncbi:Mur ligase [Apodospora peruviana]|uniref:tetrahydrofolate synthase n=1 Tax=Apodospora peruviana TaxID=516989 RepID=A0AAE0IPV0_9PEZI|nr:Mur ligase [Apodospora peruviana]
MLIRISSSNSPISIATTSCRCQLQRLHHHPVHSTSFRSRSFSGLSSTTAPSTTNLTTSLKKASFIFPSHHVHQIRHRTHHANNSSGALKTENKTLTAAAASARPTSTTSRSGIMSSTLAHDGKRNRTYDDALARLAQLQSNKAITNLFSGPNVPLDNLNALATPETLWWLNRAGYTPESIASSGLRCVHVAGTKGKGSVATLISSILTQYTNPPEIGTQIGLYTSPHVVSVRERIQLNGTPISEDKFGKYFFEVWDKLSEAARDAQDSLPEGEEYDGPATKPFYFRFLTILAFHVFIREGVKSAVIECGIGGEYDPTTAILSAPESVTACVVTQLGIDHVSMLGDTVPKIAWHKAGIFKRGVKGITRKLNVANMNGDVVAEEVMKVLRDRAAEKGLGVLEEVSDERVEAWQGIKEAKLEGPFQKYNMVLAVRAAREHLHKIGVADLNGFELSNMPDRVMAGLKSASLRGRSEKLVDGDMIEWFVDGAHTEDSLRGVGQWFAREVSNSADEWLNVLLFNQQDRDPEVLLKALLSAAEKEFGGQGPLFTHAIFTRNEESSSGSDDLVVQNKARDVFLGFVGGSEAEIKTWTKDAVGPSMDLIRDMARKNDNGAATKYRVLVTGSFHLVGAVLRDIDRVRLEQKQLPAEEGRQ